MRNRLTKQKRAFTFILTAVFIVSTAGSSFALSVAKKDLSDVLPQADVFVRETEPFGHYLGYASGGGYLVGAAFLTTEVVPEESWGYRDQIFTLVGVNFEGKITGVKILQENETPRYTRGLLNDGSWFLLQFTGKDVGDNFLLGRDVDAITGATISSSAITRAIETGARAVSEKVLYLEAAQESSVEHLLLHHLLWQVNFIFLWIILGLAFLAFFKKSRPLRYLVLGLSIVYIGFLKGGGFSVIDVLNIFSLNLPIFLNNLYWYSLIIIAIGLTVIAGRFYCGWLCPFGAILETLHKAVPPEYKFSENADRHLKLVKYVIFAVLLTIAFLLSSKDSAIYIAGIIEPFATFFRLYGNLIAWIWLITILLISSVVSRFYCKYLCPLGAFFALLTLAASFLKIPRLKVALAEEDCKGCRLAEKICQMEAISYDNKSKRPGIDVKECFMCDTCAGICPAHKEQRPKNENNQ